MPLFWPETGTCFLSTQFCSETGTDLCSFVCPCANDFSSLPLNTDPSLLMSTFMVRTAGHNVLPIKVARYAAIHCHSRRLEKHATQLCTLYLFTWFLCTADFCVEEGFLPSRIPDANEIQPAFPLPIQPRASLSCAVEQRENRACRASGSSAEWCCYVSTHSI